MPIESAAYRQHVMGRELAGYSADIICLQELTEPVFNGALEPTLATQGFGAEYATPPPAASSELATFWRTAKLERLQSVVWHIGQLLNSEPQHASLREQLESCSPSLAVLVRSQPHVAHAMAMRYR